MNIQEAIKTARHKARIEKREVFRVCFYPAEGERIIIATTNDEKIAKNTLAGWRFTYAIALSTPPGVCYTTPYYNPGCGDWARQARTFWREYIGPAIGGAACSG